MKSFQSRGRQKDVSALHEYLTECVWPSPVLKRWRFSCLICFLPEWVLAGFPGWWPSYPRFSGWMLLWLRAEILQVRTRWFLSGVHADTGREAFPLQVQPPVQTGSSSGFRESSFSQKSFPSRFTTWNGPAGKGLPVPEPLIQRKGDRLLAQGPYGIDGHLENCEKLRQAENSHFLSARSLMIVTASICDCFFMHIRTWLLHLTFLSLCNMVRLYTKWFDKQEKLNVWCPSSGYQVHMLTGICLAEKLSFANMKWQYIPKTYLSEENRIQHSKNRTSLNVSLVKHKRGTKPRGGQGGCEEIIVLGEEKPLWTYNFYSTTTTTQTYTRSVRSKLRHRSDWKIIFF